MAYYTVTAISEERNVTCNVTSDEYVHNCSIPDASIDDFLFSVYSVTEGIEKFFGSTGTFNCSEFSILDEEMFIYKINMSTKCIGFPFPENVVAIEEECGLQYQMNISWKVSCRFVPMNLHAVFHGCVGFHFRTVKI